MKLIRTAILFGAGYVLGSRAGRERYEQIKDFASNLWESSPLEQGREKAKDTALSGLQRVKDAAVNTAYTAAQTVKNKATRAEETLDDDVVIVEPFER